MTAPKEVVDLVERFKKHESEYKRSEYSEEDTKDEFISPLFEALGWDVHNKQGNSPSQKEVRFESQQRIPGGKIQHPDYTFYIDGNQRFLVEAKKPFKNLSADRTLIDQVRKYGYRAGFFLSIITDFEELVIYDTRFKPHQNDDYLFYRLKYYKYTEYVEKWDEISSILSKNAVENHEHLDILPEYELQNSSTNNNRKVEENLEKDIEENQLSVLKTSDDINKINETVELTISSIIDKINDKGVVRLVNSDFVNHGGIVLSVKDVFVINKHKKEEFINEDPKNAEILKPVLDVDDIDNQKQISEKYLITTKKGMDVKNEYPVIYDYLLDNKDDIEETTNKGNPWYTIRSYPDDLDNLLFRPKIIFPSKKNHFVSLIDFEGYYSVHGSENFIYHKKDDLFALRILNSILTSNLMSFYIKTLTETKYKNKKLFISSAVNEIPLLNIDKNDSRISQLDNLINKLENEKNILNELRNDSEDINSKTQNLFEKQINYIEEQIQELDSQINEIIYDLYDITLKEREFIERNLEIK